MAIRDLLPRFARVASLICGVAIFGPAIVAIVYYGPQDLRDAVIVLGTTGLVWALAFVPSLAKARSWIQFLVGLSILSAPLVLTQGPAWVVPSTVGFGVMVAVVFNFRPLIAVPLVLLTTGAVAFVTVTNTPAAGFVVDTPLGGYLGAIMVGLAGLGLTMSLWQWGRLVDQMDDQRSTLRAREAERRRSLEISRHRRLIERRIHETVLNTLSALAYGVAPENRATAIAACRHDIDNLDLDNQAPGDAPASVVALLATEVFAASHLRVDIEVLEDPVIPAARAEALRDALVEGLRNVERHSAASAAIIRITGTDPVVVSVTDHGKGFDPESTERFGLETSVRAGIESVGGSSEIASSPTVGTTLSLTVPTNRSPTVEEPDFPARRVLSWSFLGRLGLLGVSGTLAASGWNLTESSPDPSALRVALATMVALTFCVAGLWNTRWRVAAALSGVAVTVACFVLSLPLATTCATSGDLAWLIALLGGAALIFHLALSFWWLRLLTLGTVSVVGFLVAQSMPSSCAAQPTLSAVTNVLFVGGVVLGFVWIDVIFERQRRADLELWERLIREQAEVAGRAAFSAGWAIVDEPARSLLRRIASGALDPAAESTSSAAGVCAAAIRSHLNRVGSSTSPTERLIADLESIARGSGGSLEVHRLQGHHRVEDYPDAIAFACRQVVRRAPGALIRVVTLIDGQDEEIAIHVSPWPARLREGLIPQGRWEDCRIDLDVDPLEPDEARLSVRRPEVRA